ncbi:hypothetical protein BaRGS_00017462 [Batillaria attramentaria]|uniref:RING-type domain-containing protein n=1 Tax=Batillaria attramentaria TaxID=370345 RepID=A0ABD0KWG9_9CAEN
MAIHAVPADVSSVDLTVLRAVSGWTLQGNVNISSVYSSLGRYSCSWIRRFQNGTESTVPDVRLTLSPDPSNTTNQQDREGSCSFTKNLPSTMGNVIYRVSVSPGNSESEQSIQIVHRTPLHVQHSERGETEGRLMWYRGLGTNNLINSGTYGDNVLEMTPQVLTLSDHGVTQFRCDVDRAVDVTGAGYTADVGYPPSSTQLSISPPKLSENQAVTIDCQANGRPTPNMTLIRRDRGTVMSVELSPLSYTIPRSSCEDAGDYTCVASNSMGPDRENTDTMIVKCKPQTDRIPLSGVKVKLNDQPVTLSFDIRSYPAPDNFTFAYLGETSNTSTTRPLPQDIYLNAACVAKSSTPYEATCTVTVSRVSSRSAAGYFIMRVINSEGYQDYMFQIILDEEDENRSGTDSTSSVAIGLGVILAVLVLGVAVVVVWLWRRQWILPCAAREAATETTSRPLSTRDKSAPGKNLFEMPSTVPRAPAGPYDSLQMQDVGLRSPYAEIGHADDIEDTSAPYETPGIEPTNATPEEAEPLTLFDHVSSYDVALPYLIGVSRHGVDMTARVHRDCGFLFLLDFVHCRKILRAALTAEEIQMMSGRSWWVQPRINLLMIAGVLLSSPENKRSEHVLLCLDLLRRVLVAMFIAFISALAVGELQTSKRHSNKAKLAKVNTIGWQHGRFQLFVDAVRSLDALGGRSPKPKAVASVTVTFQISVPSIRREMARMFEAGNMSSWSEPAAVELESRNNGRGSPGPNPRCVICRQNRQEVVLPCGHKSICWVCFQCPSYLNQCRPYPLCYVCQGPIRTVFQDRTVQKNVSTYAKMRRIRSDYRGEGARGRCCVAHSGRGNVAHSHR